MTESSLKRAREARGLSQQDLGSRLSVSKGFISKLESGAEKASLELALRIQLCFEGDVTAAELRPDLADLLADAMAVAPREDAAA